MSKYIRLPKWMVFLVYVLFAAIIVVVEEIIMAYQTYVAVCKIADIMQRNKDGETIKPFELLSMEDQKGYEKHYEEESIRNRWRLQIMTKESSVQLIYQNALVMYQFFYPPVYELDFNWWRYPSAQWMAGVGFQIFSILLSGYTTFNPILENMKFKSHVEGKPAGFDNYMIKVYQVLGHVLIATGTVFLLLGHTNIFYCNL